MSRSPSSFEVYSNGCGVAHDAVRLFAIRESAGIFETMRTYAGRIFRREEHLERLVDSAHTSGFELPLSRAGLRRELDRDLAAFVAKRGGSAWLKKNDVLLRITLYPEHVLVLIGERRYPGSLYTDGVTLKTSCVRRSHTNAAAPQTKTHAYQNAVLAALQPDPDHDEWIFLDPEGYVGEVSIGNLFIIKKDRLETPPASGILNGVTRRFVLECGLRAGMKTAERPLTRHELFNADEVFLTNTSWEVLPVRKVDGRSIGTAVLGKQTATIHRIFKKRAREECQKSKSAAH